MGEHGIVEESEERREERERERKRGREGDIGSSSSSSSSSSTSLSISDIKDNDHFPPLLSLILRPSFLLHNTYPVDTLSSMR